MILGSRHTNYDSRFRNNESLITYYHGTNVIPNRITRVIIYDTGMIINKECMIRSPDNGQIYDTVLLIDKEYDNRTVYKKAERFTA